MNETDNDPRPDWAAMDWAAMGWITDRLPTRQDADSDGDVWLPRETGDSAGEGTYVSYLAVVALGQPWWSLNAADRANQSAPTEPDRIAALEQRVGGLERMFWAHRHEALPVSVSSASVPSYTVPESQP